MENRHVGSDFDEFLREQGLLDEAEAVAAKRVRAALRRRLAERLRTGEGTDRGETILASSRRWQR